MRRVWLAGALIVVSVVTALGQAPDLKGFTGELRGLVSQLYDDDVVRTAAIAAVAAHLASQAGRSPRPPIHGMGRCGR